MYLDIVATPIDVDDIQSTSSSLFGIPSNVDSLTTTSANNIPQALFRPVTTSAVVDVFISPSSPSLSSLMSTASSMVVDSVPPMTPLTPLTVDMLTSAFDYGLSPLEIHLATSSSSSTGQQLLQPTTALQVAAAVLGVSQAGKDYKQYQQHQPSQQSSFISASAADILPYCVGPRQTSSTTSSSSPPSLLSTIDHKQVEIS